MTRQTIDKMEKARLIIDSPANGAWNMAVDQALLETADRTGQITLRFYRWSAPTLSLGYFQSHLDRKQHPPSSNCNLVRRRTGGGAIVHDQEITYSLCIPSANRWSKKNTRLSDEIHQRIIQLLTNHKIDSCLYQERSTADSNLIPPETDIDNDSFLCFQRRSPGDVVLNDFKIAGSAQRRIKNALLQHGSILCNRSPCSPELPGIHDLANLSLSDEEIIQNLAIAIEQTLQVELFSATLSNIEFEAAKSAYSIQFDSDAWNLRR